eukprot:TRINITY_DN1584_c0_g1_i1.p1 TRINITY_DN1584_c0_g1~~TRINITY_DN1584_c0_g1_i1.p1  ORF type:complete len:385 (-),score=34.28 TRINITY_DN1584_c0_g1_i1:64-1191(-)
MALNSTTAYDCVISGCTAAGLCNEETLACDCRDGWIAQDCSLFFYQYDSGLWAYYIVHLVFFCLAFIGVMIWAIILIVKLFKAKNFDRKEVNKPTLTLFILVLFFGFERAFYIALYQYGRILEIPEVVGSILFGFAISTLIAMQLFVCNLWIAAYLKTKPRMANVLKRLQSAFKWIAIGFAIWELIVDILTSIPQTSPETRAGIQIVYFIIVLLLLFSTTISLLVFGAKLRRQLKIFKDIDNKRKKVIKKINSFGITVSVIMIFVFIILIGLIIISTSATEDIIASTAFVIVQEALMRTAELAYCITVLVTYQKSVKKPMSSSSGQTGKSASRPASATIIADPESKHIDDHIIISPNAEAISPADTEMATPSTAN